MFHEENSKLVFKTQGSKPRCQSNDSLRPRRYLYVFDKWYHMFYLHIVTRYIFVVRALKINNIPYGQAAPVKLTT